MKKIELHDVKNLISALKNNPKAVVAIVFFLFLLDVAVVLRGQMVSLSSMFSRAKKINADIQDAKNNFQFFSTNKGKKQELQQKLLETNKKILPEEELPRVLETISKFADTSLVRIQQIRPVADIAIAQKLTSAKQSQGKPQEVFVRQKIAMTVVTGFHQLGRFVAFLENSPVFFDIRQIEIRADQQLYTKQMVTILLEVVLKKS